MRLRDIKKGQHFGETDCGLTIICEALEDAQPRGTDCHSLRAKVLLGHAATADADGVVHFLEADNPGGYGLQLHDDAAIDVWRVSFDGSHYLTDREPDAAVTDSGAKVESLKMSRNRYASLPEFSGF